MKTWYKVRPVDTFFFKGATPMVMGENHTSETVFPPSAETIAGAVRTATLLQQDIDFNDYCQQTFNDDRIITSIGRAGDPPPFEIMGPVFLKNSIIYVPAPFHWYVEKTDIDKNKQTDIDMNKKESTAIPVYRSRPVQSDFVNTSRGTGLYAAIGRKGELRSAGGLWVKLEDLNSDKTEIEFKFVENFFTSEPRTGIALENNRKVKESHLYTFTHIRLHPDTQLIFGISQDTEPLFAPGGILYLGGEKRLGYYQKIQIPVPEQEKDADMFMTLSAMPCKSVDTDLLVATGKILYRGGWDMKKKFHKPLTGFYPAGTVFSKKTDKNQLPVKGE